MNKLAKEIINKDIRSIAKLLRLIEKKDKKAVEALKSLYPQTGNAHIIGITGLPGSGKSTIIDTLIKGFRENNETVAVIAIDPTSPYTGGSLLGDRIRMQKHSTDPGTFIKSIPTSGWHGGISRVTSKMVTVMDAAGYDRILVETVGVGQAEVDIASMVHTTVVVLIGGLGDYIQVIKAGILEIADIYVINKTDKDGAQDLEQNLKNLRALSSDGTAVDWDPPVILTQATKGKGMDKLSGSINLHKEYLERSGKFKEFFMSRYDIELNQLILGHMEELLVEKVKNDPGFIRSKTGKDSKDPYTEAEKIFNILFNRNKYLEEK
jgi:LAO/AO transport system kinase